MTSLTPEEFTRRFDTCTTGFRIEVLQDYNVPEEADSLRAWAAGEQLPPSSWRAFLLGSPASWQRVHVVREPIDPRSYLAYELHRYRGNADVGEDIRIAVLNQHPELERLRQDWWGFDLDTDHPTIVIMRYDPSGRLLGFDEDSSPVTVDRCRADRAFVLDRAVGLRDYLASASTDTEGE